MITQELIKERFIYQEGKLYFRIDRGNKKAGTLAGNQRKDGYIDIFICGKLVRAHRLIWMMHHGVMPEFIDHINGIRNDNRIENLRVATRSQNQMNLKKRVDNTSGYTGVVWHRLSNKWIATIQINYKSKYLGLFEKKEDAILERKKAEQLYFGEFARIK